MTIRISVARVPDRCTVLRCDVCEQRVILHQSDHRYGALVRDFIGTHEKCDQPVDIRSAEEDLQDELARARNVLRHARLQRSGAGRP